MTNIHLDWHGNNHDDGDIIMVYGACDQSHHSEAHHEVGRFSARDHDEMP